jgi:hypothetical protein
MKECQSFFSGIFRQSPDARIHAAFDLRRVERFVSDKVPKRVDLVRYGTSSDHSVRYRCKQERLYYAALLRVS